MTNNNLQTSVLSWFVCSYLRTVIMWFCERLLWFVFINIYSCNCNPFINHEGSMKNLLSADGKATEENIWKIDYDITFFVSHPISTLDPYQPLGRRTSGWYGSLSWYGAWYEKWLIIISIYILLKNSLLHLIYFFYHMWNYCHKTLLTCFDIESGILQQKIAEFMG